MNHYKAVVLILITSFAFLPVVSPAQMTWTCATDSAAWSPRSWYASVVFDGMMWVLGGCEFDDLNFPVNDVWCSTNGADWTLITDSADWSPRYAHEVVVLRDTMWLIGGLEDYYGDIILNDVWYSTNGADWTWVTDSADWQARAAYGLIAFNNEIWLMGGWGGWSVLYLDDVWRSPEGVNWTCVDSAADWVARCNHTLTDFSDSMWVMAGFAYVNLGDVWCSSDGSSWVCATAAAEWSARNAPCAVAFDNKIWMIGGYAGGVCLQDVWFSNDGANWTCADSSANWQPRAWHESLVYDNKIWVLGGAQDVPGGLNDVWYSTGLGIEEDNTSITKEHYLGSTIFSGPLLLPEGKECRVFDIIGRTVAPDIIQPGIYFIEIDGVVTQKVVKVR